MAREINSNDLERKIAQTRRLALSVTDGLTQRRLGELEDELSESLRRSRHRRASVNESRVRARAHELWEQQGMPEGRDLEFWLRAERELGGDANDL